MNGCWLSGRLRLNRLGLAASFWPRVASAAAHAKAAATSVTREATAALATRAVSPTAAGTASAGSKVGSVAIGTGATLLNGYLFSSNLVGVGRNGSGVAGRVRKFHKSAVLDLH